MDHSPGFLTIVNDAKTRIKEITIDQARERLKQNPKAILIDVREDAEWQNGHAAEAIHLRAQRVWVDCFTRSAGSQ